MSERGVDALLLSVGSDLPYLTGYRAMPLERLTMAVITTSDAALVVPELEAPRVDARRSPIPVVAWGETDDPIELVAGHVHGAGTIGVGGQTWSQFLLRLQKKLPTATWLDASELIAPLRIRKGPEEIAALERVAMAVDEAMVRLAGVTFSGRTEADVASEIDRMLRASGHETVEFVIVASGPNGASPHHESGGRIIEPGDLVVCDFGGSIGGYQSDSTRTFAVGDPDEAAAHAHATLRQAQEAAVAAVAPGVPCEEIDRAARTVIAEAGYGEYFIHRVGHGIGLDVHEQPYLVEGNKGLLQDGMVFSVEPGIYVPGRFGMRIEDIVVVEDTGGRRLNHSPRDLVTVE